MSTRLTTRLAARYTNEGDDGLLANRDLLTDKGDWTLYQ